ncbi:unnamed protein product [Moneuplotes crassus]|uniref:Uncharacterized protein n=1 Tax=Euplotes crassus TaxID=5936 RepID=A0AAD1XSG7_EUPCR|nr:unnamed protein product [Moneuplotes crassus]
MKDRKGFLGGIRKACLTESLGKVDKGILGVVIMLLVVTVEANKYIATYKFAGLGSLPSSFSDIDSNPSAPDLIVPAVASSQPLITQCGLVFSSTRHLDFSKNFKNKSRITGRIWFYLVQGVVDATFVALPARLEGDFKSQIILYAGIEGTDFNYFVKADSKKISSGLSITAGWNSLGFAVGSINLFGSVLGESGEVYGKESHGSGGQSGTLDGYIGCKYCADHEVEFIIHSMRLYKGHSNAYQKPNLNGAVVNSYLDLGNGVLDVGEECDDGNLAENDGCDRNGQIDEGYVCINKLPTSTSLCQICKGVGHCLECSKTQIGVCTKCEDEYDLVDSSCVITPQQEQQANTTNTTSSQIVMSESAQQMSSGSKAASGLSLIAIIAISILNFTSIAAIWSIVSQFQILMLLLLTKTPFPDDIKGIILGNKALSFDFSIIPVQEIPKFNCITSWIDIDQKNVYLETIGFGSASSLVNNFSFGSCFILMLLLYPLVYLLKCFIDFGKEEKCSINYLLMKLFDLWNFTIFIRIALSGFQALMVSSYSEVLSFDVHTTQDVVSLVIAFVGVVFCAFILLVSIWFFVGTLKSYDKDNHYKCGEFIEGVKASKIARMYNSMSLIRRTLLILFVLSFNHVRSFYLCLGFVVIQICYLLFIVIVRPLDKAQNNLIEAVNEIILLNMALSGVFFDTPEKWNDTVKTIFMYVLMSNSLIIMLIMIVVLCLSLSSKFCKKSSKNSKTFPTRIEVEERMPEFGNRYRSGGNSVSLSGIQFKKAR